MDWTETTARLDENYLSFGIWCIIYKGVYGNHIPYEMMDVITYPCPSLSWTISVKGLQQNGPQ